MSFIPFTLPEVVARELRDGRLFDCSYGNDAITHSYCVKGQNGNPDARRLWIDADNRQDREYEENDRYTVLHDPDAGFFSSETDVNGALIALYQAEGLPVPIYLRQSGEKVNVNGSVVTYLGRYVRNKIDVCVIEDFEAGERAYLEYDHPTHEA